jgi:hypothetical protein
MAEKIAETQKNGSPEAETKSAHVCIRGPARQRPWRISKTVCHSERSEESSGVTPQQMLCPNGFFTLFGMTNKTSYVC